jgi:hypothetical protein
MTYLLIILMAVYLVYTLNFAVKFNKINTIFNHNQKLIHNCLIWIIPFFWIMIIKTMMKPTPGSDKFEKTRPEADFKENQFF